MDPAFEKQRAPLRLMSWCTCSVPYELRQTLYRLSTLCAKHSTTPELLLEEANRVAASAEWGPSQTASDPKSYLPCQWTGVDQLSWCRWQLPTRATFCDGSLHVGLLSPANITSWQRRCRRHWDTSSPWPDGNEISLYPKRWRSICIVSWIMVATSL